MTETIIALEIIIVWWGGAMGGWHLVTVLLLNFITDWDLSVALSSVGWPVCESPPNDGYAGAGVRVEVLIDSHRPPPCHQAHSTLS